MKEMNSGTVVLSLIAIELAGKWKKGRYHSGAGFDDLQIISMMKR